MQNPFIIQRDILYGEPFCDRAEEIERYLAAARMGESLCLISPRRYGKTSLLNQVGGRLQEQGWLTAKIDFMQTLSDVEIAKEISKTAMLTVTREETEAFLEVNRKIPLNHMTVLRQIAIRRTIPKPYSGEFLRICKLTQSQMQKIIESLIADDRIYRNDAGLHIADPLERMALRLIGTSSEWRSEMIQNLLNRAETGINI